MKANALAATERLRQLKRALDNATCDSNVDAIAREAIAAIVAGYEALLSEGQIAELLGITTAELHERLRQSAFQVTGVEHAQEGDLILEMDGRPAGLVVRKRFSPAYEGGPRCMGLYYPRSGNPYNIWENTDLPHPGAVRMLLVRPPTGRSDFSEFSASGG